MIMDKEKTEKLLKGLKEEGVTVENIDQYLQQQGIIVDIHVGRIRGVFKIKPETYGVKVSDSEELKTFFSDYMIDGKMSFIPKSMEKKYQTIETSVRKKRKDCAVGYDGKYLPIELYKEFKEYFLKKKEEYINHGEDILAQWDTLMNIFRVRLEEALRKMNAVDRPILRKEILAKIPTKEQYENSLYFDTSLKAFPVMTNLSLFDDSLEEEVKESMENDKLQAVYDILGDIMADAFSTVSSIYTHYKDKEAILDKHLSAIKRLIGRLKKRNVLKNPLIDSIVNDLNNVLKTPSIEEKGDLIELILATIYGFADEMEVTEKLNLSDCALSQKSLLVIYKTM